MAGFLSDMRFALRALGASPSFVVLAVVCLGIGIGASTMTFTVVDNALLKPLGSVDPDGLVGIWETHRSAPNQWTPPSRANFLDWETSAAGSARMSALAEHSFGVGADGSERRVEGAYVTDDFFSVLGVAPILGRGLQAGDDAAGAEPVVVLSETLWRAQLGSDRAILGRPLLIDGTPHTVVGVVPALISVGMPRVIRAARLWVPLRESSQPLARDDRSLFVVARLSAGVSVERFAARLETVARDLAAMHRENAGWSVRVGPLGGSAFGNARSMLLLSLGAAALVLLIACANVANLTLAHAARRRHELAIRLAIGASPWRIARQLLGESLLVATLGAALGLIIARWGLDALARFYAADTLAPAALPIDTRSLAFTVGVTFITSVSCGLSPALKAARGAARARIAESGTGTTTARAQDRLRRALVVGQVAPSLALLVAAALMSRSFANMLALDPGVETERVTSVRVDPLEGRSAPEDVASYVERMLDALAAVPGIETAASSNALLPLRGGGFRSRVGVPESIPNASAGPVVAYAGVTPTFFDALGIPLLRGRTFGANDARGRFAVVNESFANLLWPGQDPVGRQFRLAADVERGWITVAGVSGDFLTWDSSGDEPLPTAYLDVESFDVLPVFFFARKRSADQIVGTAALSRAIESLGIPSRRIVVTPMAQVARDPFWRQQVFSVWFAASGIAALTLAAAGIYGVLSYLVWQRWREIGIRMALGADRRKVLLMVLSYGGRSAGAGIVAGLAGAYALAHAMRNLLFRVEPIDWTVFITATVFLAVVAVVASIAPALRAARIDPNALLKN